MGKNLIHLPVCESTNEWAARLALAGRAPEGTVVITDDQTRGKGQRGNVWLSEPGRNLTLSLVLAPAFLPPVRQFQITQAISLGVLDCIQALCQERTEVKWPNDLLINNRKACGILIENQLRGNEFVFAIAGIGLNVNQRHFSLSSATSLALETGHEFKLDLVFQRLLGTLENRYQQLRSGRVRELETDYLQALHRRDTQSKYASHGHSFEGTIRGVDAYGKLRVEVQGVEKVFQNKEIEYLNE